MKISILLEACRVCVSCVVVTAACGHTPEVRELLHIRSLPPQNLLLTKSATASGWCHYYYCMDNCLVIIRIKNGKRFQS